MVIFDFDQTLVNTSSVEHLRAARNWKGVMDQASRLPIYDGVHDMIKELYQAGQPLAILTKSPDMVAKAFIRAHGWPISIVLGYHQVRNRKPHPEGLFLAMERAGASPEDTYHVGDQRQDTEASRAAGVGALGAGWGIENTDELEASNPDKFFDTVGALREYFKQTL